MGEDVRNQLALEAADEDLAFALWREGDWVTYSAIRNTLVGLVRMGQRRVLERRHLAFICFVNRHLRWRFNEYRSDRYYFLRSA